MIVTGLLPLLLLLGGDGSVCPNEAAAIVPRVPLYPSGNHVAHPTEAAEPSSDINDHFLGLLPLLRSDDRIVGRNLYRATAVITQSAKGSEICPQVLDLLKQGGDNELQWAGWVLCAFGVKASGVKDPLIELLKTTTGKMRAETAQVLGEIGPAARTALPTLEQCFTDRDPQVRINAARAVWNIEKKTSPAQMAVLTKELKEKEPRDPSVITAAIGALGAMGSEAKGAATELKRYLADDDFSIRFEAAQALIAIDKENKDSAKLLLECLNDTRVVNTRHRVPAAVALLKSPEFSARAAARLLAFSDGKQEDRYPSALGYLASTQLPNGQVVRTLSGALSDPSPVVRQMAAYSLGNVGRPASSALDELRRHLLDEDRYVRWQAECAIRKIESK